MIGEEEEERGGQRGGSGRSMSERVRAPVMEWRSSQLFLRAGRVNTGGRRLGYEATNGRGGRGARQMLAKVQGSFSHHMDLMILL